jgi:hypothetical protein
VRLSFASGSVAAGFTSAFISEVPQSPLDEPFFDVCHKKSRGRWYYFNHQPRRFLPIDRLSGVTDIGSQESSDR